MSTIKKTLKTKRVGPLRAKQPVGRKTAAQAKAKTVSKKRRKKR